MQQAGDRELVSEEERDMVYDFAADLGDIIVHGLFSINCSIRDFSFGVVGYRKGLSKIL